MSARVSKSVLRKAIVAGWSIALATVARLASPSPM